MRLLLQQRLHLQPTTLRENASQRHCSSKRARQSVRHRQESMQNQLPAPSPSPTPSAAITHTNPKPQSETQTRSIGLPETRSLPKACSSVPGCSRDRDRKKRPIRVPNQDPTYLLTPRNKPNPTGIGHMVSCACPFGCTRNPIARPRPLHPTCWEGGVLKRDGWRRYLLVNDSSKAQPAAPRLVAWIRLP